MVRAQFAEFPMDTRDGVKVITKDGWFLVRGSNTEPIIRIVAEAKSEERALELVSNVSRRINSID
jgi:phosphomannomutase